MCVTCHHRNPRLQPTDGDNEHRKSTHEGNCSPCKLCEFTVGRTPNVSSLVTSFHEEHWFPCKQCEFIAEKTCDVPVHVTSVYVGRCYSCNQCRFTATGKSRLYHHVYSVHKGIKYACDLCRPEDQEASVRRLTQHIAFINKENMAWPKRRQQFYFLLAIVSFIDMVPVQLKESS